MFKKISNKGFTIVETLIVLAIAGAIITVVIIAARGLTSSNNDASLKKDAASLLAAATQYRTDNGGSAPTSCPAITAAVTGYTCSATTQASTTATNAPAAKTVILVTGASCPTWTLVSKFVPSSSTAGLLVGNGDAVVYATQNGGAWGCINS